MRETYQAIAKFLAKISPGSNMRNPTSIDYIHHTRFDLRMVLTNTELASLLGQARTQLLPDDQFDMLLNENSLSNILDKDSPPTLTFGNKDTSLAEISNHIRETDGTANDDNEFFNLFQSYENVFELLKNDINLAIEQGIVSPALKHAACTTTPTKNSAETNFRLLLSWLISFAGKGSPATRRAYWDSVWNGLLENWPGLMLWEISEEDFIEYLDSDWAYGTISKKRAAWKSLYNYLVRQNIPAQTKVDWSKIKTSWSPVETRIVAEADKLPLMQEISKLSWKLTWIIPLAGDLGLRVSEICHLKARDVIAGPMPYLIIHRSKYAKSRRVSLTTLKPKVLSSLFRMRDSLLAKEPTGNPYLITDKDGIPYTEGQLSGIVSSAMDAIGLRKDNLEGRLPTIHRLRALAAEHAFERSGDIRAAAQLLGHSMPATTIAAYILSLEARVNRKLMDRRWSFNKGNDHLPVVMLASMLSMSDRGLMEAISTYTHQHPDGPIVLRPANELPDGPRHLRRGRHALYISAEDAVKFVSGRLPRQ